MRFTGQSGENMLLLKMREQLKGQNIASFTVVYFYSDVGHNKILSIFCSRIGCSLDLSRGVIAAKY